MSSNPHTGRVSYMILVYFLPQAPLFPTKKLHLCSQTPQNAPINTQINSYSDASKDDTEGLEQECGN